MKSLTFNNRNRSGRSAFTMVELILVMTIMTVLGIFAALMIPNIQDRAKRTETRATMQLIELAIAQYREDIGHYPTGDFEAVSAVLTSPSSAWLGAGMHRFQDRKDLNDAWGMPFSYRHHHKYSTPEEIDLPAGPGVERTPKKGDYYNSQTYQLYSTGPNMRTWPKGVADGGYPSLCGTEEDDIRNWTHEEFHTPSDYGS